MVRNDPDNAVPVRCTCGHEFSRSGMFHLGGCPRRALPSIDGPVETVATRVEFDPNVRTDVPTLLAEVAKLRAEIERMRFNIRIGNPYGWSSDEIERRERAEVEMRRLLDEEDDDAEEPPVVTRVEFDPNVRTATNGTYVGIRRFPDGLLVGDQVVLFESEGGIEVDATVSEITPTLVYFDVAWDTLREVSEDASRD